MRQTLKLAAIAQLIIVMGNGVALKEAKEQVSFESGKEALKNELETSITKGVGEW